MQQTSTANDLRNNAIPTTDTPQPGSFSVSMDKSKQLGMTFTHQCAAVTAMDQS